MIMRKFLYIWAFLLLAFSDMSAQQVDKAAVKAKVNRAAMEMKSMECDFVQTKHLKMLSDKMVSKGRMYYQRKNKLRWEYTSPKKYVFVLNDTKVRIKNGDRNDLIDTNQNKVFKEIGNVMMSSVMGNCLNDTRSFKTTIAETSTEWVASLVPQRKEMKQMIRLIKLHINRQRAMVTSVELIERNGDRTVIELRNVKTNVNIPASTFAVS